jgi:putative PEP-CTERM system TPR-repeat lipoprotein
VAVICGTLIGCSPRAQAPLDSAKTYLQKNDNKAAIIEIKNALQADPNLPEARFLLGTTLLATGDPVGAEAELRKSMELKYSLDAVVPQLAKSMLAQGHAKAVTDEFSEMQLTQVAARASLQNELATGYAMQDQKDRSEAALAAALAADPDFGPAKLEQARKLAMRRDFDGAQALINQIIAKSPADFDAWKLRGDIYWIAQANGPAAIDAYGKAIALKPDFLACRNALFSLYLQQANYAAATAQLDEMKKLAANHPQTQFLAALLAYQKKDVKTANDLSQAVLKMMPNHIGSLQLAGATELDLNHLLQAQTYLSKALELRPALPTARRLLVLANLRLGQPAKALEVLLPALDQTPTDPTLTSLAGNVYLRNGNLQKAQEYFEKASAQEPKNASKRTSLALVHLLGGASDSAVAELHDISAADTGDTADMALISTYIRRKEYTKALSAIDALEKKQPGKALPVYLRGQVLLVMQSQKQARAEFERASSLEPTFFPAIASLAALDQADHKPADARKRLEALLAQDPRNVQALLALVGLAAQTGAPAAEISRLIGNAVAANPSDVRTRMVAIDFYLGKNDLKAASSAAENAASAMPKEPQVLDALGRTQKASGDLNQAVATYRKLVEAVPQSAYPYLRLAQVQLAVVDKQGAANSLRKALTIQPDFLEGQRALIALYLSENKYTSALEIAHLVQNQRADDDVGYIFEGDIHAASSQWNLAAQAYRTGLNHINTTTLAMKLHSALKAGAKQTEADRFALIWQKDHPRDAAFAFFLGDQALANNDFNAAEKHFAAVVSQQPNNPVALNNLAWVSAKLKRGNAIALAEKAVSLAPGQPIFLDTLATLHSDKGDYARALDLQAQALTMQPKNPALKLNLARIQVKAGKKELAQRSLSELATLGPAYAGRSEVEQLQKELTTAGAETASRH